MKTAICLYHWDIQPQGINYRKITIILARSHIEMTVSLFGDTLKKTYGLSGTTF